MKPLYLLLGTTGAFIGVGAILQTLKWVIKRKKMRNENRRKFLRNATKWIY